MILMLRSLWERLVQPDAPYGSDIFVVAGSEPVWLRAKLPAPVQVVREARWLMAASESIFVEAAIDPLFLVAGVR
jgi:hypothetical protein